MYKKDEIILIEDNPIDSELAIKALRKAGVNGVIRVLNDGADALDYFFGMGKYQGRNNLFSPKLILLDLKIPKVNGLEVLDLIRSNRYTRSIPVIIFSSSSVQTDIAEAYKKGANSYLIKPINFKEYCQTLKLLADYWLIFNKTPY